MSFITMSVIFSLGGVCRLLSPHKKVYSFLIKCRGTCWTTSVRVNPSSVYFLHCLKFYSLESHGRNSGDLERTSAKNQQNYTNIYVVKLKEILGCTRKEAEAIIFKVPRLTYVSLNDLSKNIEIVKLHDISLTAVLVNPWILTFSPDSLRRRLSLITAFRFENINDAVPLIEIALPRLALVCSRWQKESDWFPGSSRIEYISEELQCPVSVVCQLMVQYSFLQMIPASRFKKNLESMISAGVSLSNILKDLWSLRTRSELVEERLHRAKEVGLPVLKPWLVRCQEQVFERTLERHVQSRALLGNKSFYEFLADRLNCDIQSVKVMTARYPNISHVNIPKVNEILDFLLEEGFSMEQVQQVPRILCHSLETTRARLRELHALGFNPVSLMVLCQSQHEYHKLVHKLEQRKMRVAL